MHGTTVGDLEKEWYLYIECKMRVVLFSTCINAQTCVESVTIAKATALWQS